MLKSQEETSQLFQAAQSHGLWSFSLRSACRVSAAHRLVNFRGSEGFRGVFPWRSPDCAGLKGKRLICSSFAHHLFSPMGFGFLNPREIRWKISILSRHVRTVANAARHSLRLTYSGPSIPVYFYCTVSRVFFSPGHLRSSCFKHDGVVT